MELQKIWNKLDVAFAGLIVLLSASMAFILAIANERGQTLSFSLAFVIIGLIALIASLNNYRLVGIEQTLEVMKEDIKSVRKWQGVV